MGVNLSVRQNTNPASELKFITELGRSLLFTVHPKKVALRVAEAVRQEISGNSARFRHRTQYFRGIIKTPERQIESGI
ncbi:MAG: hypothetical protein ABI686_02855 [Acidobacteriota bacterium]